MPDLPEPVGEQAGVDDVLDDEDAIAELLLADAVVADAVADLQPGSDPGAAGEPVMGDTDQPDMGEALTQPAAVPAAPAQPTQVPPAPPGQPTQTLNVPATQGATANPAVPVFVAPTPANTGIPAAAPAGGQEALGFPQNTPWRDMQPAEQVAYWQHQARRHEDRVKAMGDYDQLKQVEAEYSKLREASQTEQEKLVAEARRQGHSEAIAAASGQLVEQWVRAAAAGRLHEDSVNALLGGLDRTRFLSQDGGGVDTAKVYALVNSIAPTAVASPQPTPGQPATPAAPAQPATAQPLVAAPAGGVPDFGQGQPATSRPSGLAAGREIARQRFAQAKKPTQ